jgi:hypothetical protein
VETFDIAEAGWGNAGWENADDGPPGRFSDFDPNQGNNVSSTAARITTHATPMTLKRIARLLIMLVARLAVDFG